MTSSEHRSFEEASLQENIFTLFEEQALATPDAVAVIDSDGSASYGALLKRAETIAGFLTAQKLAPEQAVAVLMHRRTDLLAVLLGILRAGGAYIPIDPDDPPNRVLKILASCGCTKLLGDRSLIEALQSQDMPDGSAPVTSLECTGVDKIPDLSDDLEPVPTAPGHYRLAYLLFTSGSTGEPKAVEVEHRNMLALLRAAAELLKFGSTDRYLAASTIAFDASVTELFLPLVTGASLLMRDRSILLDPKRLANDIREFGVSVVQSSPSAWSVLLSEVDDFPRVRVLITHGEAVDPLLARRLCHYGDEVWNLYGPTETTVWATGHRLSLDSATSLSRVSAPIGKPLQHVRAFVVNDEGSLVEDGVEGVLWLAGPSVTRGYRNNDELTRERFTLMEGELVYRTGDRVSRDCDGVIHYFGRNDDQMKIRGIRIEPGEVEAAILQDSRVSQVAATWFPTRSGSRSIVAAIVARPGHSIQARDLHDRLANWLPRSMIPARFMFVPWLPMSTNGKVDRKALRETAMAAHQSENWVIPAPPGHRALFGTERVIAGVWQKIIGVESVAPHDHFFSVGGDSLSAVETMIELEARFGVQLSVQLAYEAPTLEALANRIDMACERANEDIAQGHIFQVAGSGNESPIFFCHLDLIVARQGTWSLPWPVYAIVYWARGSGFVKANSIRSLASSHLEQLRQIQPGGPYRLAGFSLGGLIAFEMAQQLEAAGETVELLFLLDPTAPLQWSIEGARNSSDSREPLRLKLLRRAKRISQGPWVHGWSAWMSYLTTLPESIKHLSPVSWVHYLVVNQHLKRPNKASKLLFPKHRRRAFWFSANRIRRHYVARPYTGPALVVLCDENDRSKTAYQALLGSNSEIRMLDSAHHTIFREPAMGWWMDYLNDAIRDLK